MIVLVPAFAAWAVIPLSPTVVVSQADAGLLYLLSLTSMGVYGVILAGYSHGLRPGPCLVNGRRTRIIEAGMQSAFVEVCGQEKVGDEVVLLGDQLTEAEIAAEKLCFPCCTQ